jgi:nucleotide sugar dehydrogenase
MKISFVGLGKLGCCMASCIASKYPVVGIDIDQDIVDKINKSESPHDEPQLDKFIKIVKPSFEVTTNHKAVKDTDVTFIMVPTPSIGEGEFSSEFVEKAALEVGRWIPDKKDYHLVIITSTVTPGTINERIIPILERSSRRKIGKNLGVCHIPEFMAIGQVLYDFMNPEFLIIGESDQKAGDMALALYNDILGFGGLSEENVHRMSIRNAELTKLANNAYICMKLSFANNIGEICENMPTGNAEKVLNALGSDSRIGNKYLKAGLSYGGPCILPSTDIITINGPKKADSIDNLQLSKSNFIRDKMVREYDGKLIGIRVRGYETVWFSPEHPIYVDNTQRKDWGDMCRKYGRNKDKDFKDFKRADEIEIHDVLMIPKINRRVNSVEFDNNFMEFLGWYLAEGFSTTKDGHYRVTLRVKPKKDADRIYVLTKHLNSKINQYRKNIFEIRIYDKDLVILLKKWFGNGAKNKTLPLWVMRAPKSKLKYFLRGYLQGDGCHTKNRITFSTSSERLAKQLCWLFYSFGFYPYLDFLQSSEKTYNNHTWYSKIWNIRFSPDDSVGLEKLMELEQKSDGGLHRKMIKNTKDAFFIPVTKIERKQYHGKLYNFATETEHYSVPFVVHNCFPRDSRAFIDVVRKYESFTPISIMSDTINNYNIDRIHKKIVAILEEKDTNRLSVLGLTYKPKAPFVIESASVKIIKMLCENMVHVTAYDPALPNIKDLEPIPCLSLCKSAEHCIEDAKVLFIATPWKEFSDLPVETFKKMSIDSVILDSFGILKKLEDLKDFDYRRIGKNEETA